LAARKYSNRTCQLLLTVCLKDGDEDVISSTAFNQIPIGSEQLRIRQVLECVVQVAAYSSPSDA